MPPAFRVVFLGTPEAAVPSLRVLAAAGVRPALVVTPPARRRGRDRDPSPCPVAAAAEVLDLPVHATPDVNGAASVGALHARRPDLGVVVAFGQVLRREVLGLPRLGWLNLHFSLLPRWRGAAPVARALEAGDAETGVTVQRVVARLDAGPVVARRAVEILPGERAGELEARLADLGAALLADVVTHAAESGSLIEGKPQDEALATRAAKLAKEEGVADFSRDAVEAERRCRALHPWPLVAADVAVPGRAPVRAALHRVVAEPGAVPPGTAPGSVLEAGPAGIVVACGRGRLRLLELQRPGSRVLPAADFLRGLR